MFISHHLGGYNESLHAFPDLSTDKVIDVTKYSKIYVDDNMYIISGLMWIFSKIENRYIGGLVPYFVCNDILEGGSLITDENNTAISCVTMKKDNMYALSGLAYETFDQNINVPIYHHELENGHSVYGSIQGKYEIIKEYAKSFKQSSHNSISEYHIWVGEKLIQITSINNDKKEIFRFRIKKGGILADEYVI
ncbi:ORF MSV237 putative vaccinia B2R homolog, similar to SW:P20999 [Melanoplus sanguinipes entomopoxvirus]|uniref:ORF MSV237 putative vaccinia B2R homolog, similar to SW:P20999 n=1 Tax=Melanoplus sanguinipes entomopoxvirus TaxID=83191 RepID=Q9YVK5_MSEPV|nr:ORF MSV237 putative vaccinia B2R homolog, similar to SW:P20999 [Melanoplus sanguinipes entomopoxvirus]AAC97717.1 ORF MSV237 putative vaccinia B2R homolog, similar to SW:P20999 [Melanoplus sanguinipes entomopoxvirus 'O']